MAARTGHGAELFLFDYDLGFDAVVFGTGEDVLVDQITGFRVGAPGDDGRGFVFGDAGEGFELPGGGFIDVQGAFSGEAFGYAFGDGGGVALGGCGGVGGVFAEGVGVVGAG